MKNETIILIIAFVGVLYVMYHHNNTVASVPSNVSPASGAINLGIGGKPGTGSTYNAPTPLSLQSPTRTTNPAGPTASAGSCGGSPTCVLPPPSQTGGSAPPSYPAPPRIQPISQMTVPNPILERFPFLAGKFKAA